MFRECKKKEQLLPMDENISILENSTSGVLAVSGDEGYPYAVPLSYVYDDSKLYFHCAMEGHKIDAICKNDKVSFCVIAADKVVPEESTTYFKSVIVFGKAKMMEDDEEKREALVKLMEKYAPERKACADGNLSHVGMIALSIEHVTGKESIHLTKARKQIENISHIDKPHA